MAQDINLDNIKVDSSNKVGLYGDDLANITGAVTEIVNNSLLTTAATTAATKDAVAALSSSSAHQTASVAAAAQKNINKILYIGGAVIAGLIIFSLFGKRRRR